MKRAKARIGRLRGVPDLTSRSIPVFLPLLLLGGCLQNTVWVGTSAPKPAATPTSGPPTPTGPPVSERGGLADPSWPCAVPVPGLVTLETPVWGERYVPFYVPDSRWALASLHASMMLGDLQEWDLKLPPSFFLSTALATSYLGCSDDMPDHPDEPGWGYQRRPETDATGCLGLVEGQVWTELCRGYATDLECSPEGFRAAISSLDQDTTGRDNVSSGMAAMTMYLTMAYAMTGLHGLEDPDVFFVTHPDRLSRVKWASLAQIDSPWSGGMATSLMDCGAQALESCLTEGSSGRVRMETVAGYVQELDAAVHAGNCFDGPISPSDIDAHIDSLSGLLVTVDLEPARMAGQAALEEALARDEATIQLGAMLILEAIHQEMDWRLRCPGASLQYHYGLVCPP